jgi:hypothetical protein
MISNAHYLPLPEDKKRKSLHSERIAVKENFYSQQLQPTTNNVTVRKMVPSRLPTVGRKRTRPCTDKKTTLTVSTRVVMVVTVVVISSTTVD